MKSLIISVLENPSTHPFPHTATHWVKVLVLLGEIPLPDPDAERGPTEISTPGSSRIEPDGHERSRDSMKWFCVAFLTVLSLNATRTKRRSKSQYGPVAAESLASSGSYAFDDTCCRLRSHNTRCPFWR